MIFFKLLNYDMRFVYNNDDSLAIIIFIVVETCTGGTQYLNALFYVSRTISLKTKLVLHTICQASISFE